MDYLGRVEKQLDLPPSEKAEVMKELRTHYEEFVEELVATGMDRAQAEEQAAEKVGKPEDIAADMRTVHVQASWKVTALVAVPFLLSVAAQLLQTSPQLSGAGMSPARFVFIPAVTALLVSGSVREITHNRRPLWLATWLPGALMSTTSSLYLVAHLLGPSDGRVVPVAEILGASVAVFLPHLSIGIWAAWPNRKLLGAVVFSELIYVLIFIATLHWHQDLFLRCVMLMWLPVGSITWAIVALRVFRSQRPGGFAVASLFLFTVFLLEIGQQYGGLTSWRLLTEGYVKLFAPLVAVIVFARARKWQYKLLSLAVAIVLLRFTIPLRGVQLDWDLWRFADTLLVLGVVIVVPLLLERNGAAQKPELAH